MFSADPMRSAGSLASLLLGGSMGLAASEKAAFVLSLVGHELAAKLFVGLSKREQSAILRSLMTGQHNLTDTDISEICSEFAALCGKNSAAANQSLRAPSDVYAGIELPRASRVNEICEEIPDWILVDYLKNQLDSVVSSVLGSIDLKRAGAVFRAMPQERQTSLLLSLSRERVLEASVLDELEQDLDELRARTASGRYGQRVGGTQRVLALVQALEPEIRQRVLEEVEAREPGLARHLEGGLLSVERLAGLLPAHLALLLAQLKDSEIGAFLRGESTKIQSIYLSGLSKRRREDVECLLAPEKKITQKQKAEACDRLRMCAQQMKGEGRILFPWEESLVG
jgi:flagellar motor switch protein FliG